LKEEKIEWWVFSNQMN